MSKNRVRGSRLCDPRPRDLAARVNAGYDTGSNLRDELPCETAALAQLKEFWDSGNRYVPDPSTLSIDQVISDIATQHDHDAFDRTAHALFALVCACLGGLGGRYFASPRCDRAADLTTADAAAPAHPA